jgi:Mrp family chromosome partitioning ATPase
MPVIAVVNRKGGSGKSTFAAHLAAWCARQGHAVMLGDVVQPPRAADGAAPHVAHTCGIGNSRPDSLMPAQEALIHGSGLMQSGSRPVAAAHHAPARILPRSADESRRVPEFLKH